MRFPGLVAAAAWLALAAVLVPAHAEKPAAPVVGNAADGDADLLRWRVAQFPISPRRSEGEETKAVLYEEDPAKPHVSCSRTAIWRVERVPAARGQQSEIVIQGDVDIPDRNVSVRVSVHRNDDSNLPASHTVEIMFRLPEHFSHGGIKNIPGIMVKEGETSRGVALNGVAVKVTDNFFMVGLSSEDAEMRRNVQLLKEPSWIDIPVVYSDGERAVISIDKGPPGERAFLEAFAAWELQDHAAKP